LIYNEHIHLLAHHSGEARSVSNIKMTVKKSNFDRLDRRVSVEFGDTVQRSPPSTCQTLGVHTLDDMKE
jgi:hypothetical protein